MGMLGPSDIVNRSITPGKDRMYLLEPLSAEPIALLYESAGQQLLASSASQYTPRINFEESQIAMVMLMMLGKSTMVKPRRVAASSRTQKACIDSLPSGAAQLYHIGDGLSVCFQTPRVCCQTRRRRN